MSHLTHVFKRLGDAYDLLRSRVYVFVSDKSSAMGGDFREEEAQNIIHVLNMVKKDINQIIANLRRTGEDDGKR